MEFAQRRTVIMEAVAEAARNIVPVLKDHNLNHSAKVLEEVLFAADALTQELEAFLKENAEVMASIMGG